VNILIVGFACSPRLGGEPSNAWNWAWQLSRCHQVWLLAHSHDRESVEEFLAKHPNPNLKFRWVTVPRLLDLWDHRGSNVGLAIHYLLWLKLALRKAINLHAQIGFHIVHHVSYGQSTRRLRFGSYQFLLCGGRRRSSASALFIPSLFWLFVEPGNPSKHSYCDAASLLFPAQGCEVKCSYSRHNRETARLLSRVGGEMSDYSWIPEFPPISFQARPFPRLETGPSPCFG